MWWKAGCMSVGELVDGVLLHWPGKMQVTYRCFLFPFSRGNMDDCSRAKSNPTTTVFSRIPTHPHPIQDSMTLRRGGLTLYLQPKPTRLRSLCSLVLIFHTLLPTGIRVFVAVTCRNTLSPGWRFPTSRRRRRRRRPLRALREAVSHKQTRRQSSRMVSLSLS